MAIHASSFSSFSPLGVAIVSRYWERLWEDAIIAPSSEFRVFYTICNQLIGVTRGVHVVGVDVGETPTPIQ